MITLQVVIKLFILQEHNKRLAYFQKSIIDVVLFSDALREWQYCKFELDRLRGINVMECPACSKGFHACHVDGNRKIYRYAYNKRQISKVHRLN